MSHLLQEVCLFSLALEVEDRTKFYQKLCSYGLMPSIEGMLVSDDADVVATAIDILNSIAEFNSCVLRDHILQTNASEVGWVSVCVGGERRRKRERERESPCSRGYYHYFSYCAG